MSGKSELKVRYTLSPEAVREATIRANGVRDGAQQTVYLSLDDAPRDLVERLVDLTESPINLVKRVSDSLIELDLSLRDDEATGLYVRVPKVPKETPEQYVQSLWGRPDECSRVPSWNPPEQVGYGLLTLSMEFDNGLAVPGSESFRLVTLDSDDLDAMKAYVVQAVASLHSLIDASVEAVAQATVLYREWYEAYVEAVQQVHAKNREINQQFQESREQAEAQRQAQEAEEKAAKAAAAEARRKDRLDWIRAHGSAKLRAMVDDGYACRELYRNERALFEVQSLLFGDTAVMVVDEGIATRCFKTRSCPSDVGYAVERLARERFTALPAGSIRTLWLDVPSGLSGATADGRLLQTVLLERREHSVEQAAVADEAYAEELANSCEVLSIRGLLPGYRVILVVDPVAVQDAEVRRHLL